MVNSPCDGTGSWQVDLGGVYNLTRLVFWNRYPYVSTNTSAGGPIGANANGAILTYLNGFGYWVGQVTLTGGAIQSIPVVLSPPSQTPTSTQTSTSTPSQSASSSATLSLGATPSGTGTPTQTPTTTTTTTPTGTPTPSAPLLPYTYAVTVSTVATSQILNFVEVFVFSSTGQDVGAGAPFGGATTSWTAGTPYNGSQYLSGYGNDLLCDPYLAATTSSFAALTTSGSWMVTFAKTATFPNGQPAPVSQGECSGYAESVALVLAVIGRTAAVNQSRTRHLRPFVQSSSLTVLMAALIRVQMVEWYRSLRPTAAFSLSVRCRPRL